MWTQPGFTFTGRIYRTDRAELTPKPERRIPIWLGTFGNRALQVTGRLATRDVERVEITTSGGVTYELSIPLGTFESLPARGEPVTLYTHLVVRDDEWRWYATLVAVPSLGPGTDHPAVAEQVEIETKYAGYLDRQREEIARSRLNEGTPIPDGFDYVQVRGLSAEVTQKLERVRPKTIGQAQRIPGVPPAAISLLLVHLARSGRQGVAIVDPQRATAR